jgi:UDPglucose 6-dehydrogenase
VRALQRTATENGLTLQIMAAVEAVNQRQKTVIPGKIAKRFGEDLTGLRFAVWGLSFKPGTDDMREAPSRVIIRALVAAGASVSCHDPVAMDEARHFISSDLADLKGGFDRVSFHATPMGAAEGADALVIATEWKVFRGPDFTALKAALKKPIIFDGRNLYDPAFMDAQGVEYHPIGRSGGLEARKAAARP